MPENDTNLIRLRSALEGFSECAYQLKQEAGFRAVKGSRKRMEEAEADEFHVGRAYACAFLLLVACEDHLQSLARLLSHTPLTQFGIPVLCRATLENAGRAGWLLDQGITAHERMGRGLTVWLTSLQESKEVMQVYDHSEGQKRDEKEIATAITAAESFGFTIGKDRAGRHRIVKEEPLPSATNLAEGVAGPSGRAMYKQLSAATHGTTYGLLSHYDFKKAAKGQLVSPAISLGLLAAIVGTAGVAFAMAFGRQVQLYGWNDDIWRSWSSHGIGVFQQAMRPWVEEPD